MNKLFPIFIGVFLSLLIGVAAVAAQENAVKTVNGGVLNGRAMKLPLPKYPEDAKKDEAEGAIAVTITIDEDGNVTSAAAALDYQTAKRRADGDTPEAKPAHPLLRDAAEKAAMEAKFAPTQLNGQPVKVTGSIIYNFVASHDRDGNSIRTLSGGVLNGKATSLPPPAYPPAAQAVGAGGTVMVQVTIDEQGNVVSAEAISGHPLLRGAATEAAAKSTFSPTRLSGEPVRVSGVITYTFAAPAKPDNY